LPTACETAGPAVYWSSRYSRPLRKRQGRVAVSHDQFVVVVYVPSSASSPLAVRTPCLAGPLVKKAGRAILTEAV